MDMTEQLIKMREDSTQQHAWHIICSKIQQRLLEGHNTATINFDIDQFPEITSSLDAAGYDVIKVSDRSCSIVWQTPFVEEA